MDIDDTQNKRKEENREHDGKVKFAFQFSVNSNTMVSVTIATNHIFKKSEYTENKPMKIKTSNKKPSEYYQKIVNDFSLPVLEAFKKLKDVITEIENEEDFSSIINDKSKLCQVEIYVPFAIEMCIRNIKTINRVKMERMMIIIRTGINSYCDYEITEALVELETLVKLYYPEDRRYFCENKSNEFKNSIINMTIVKPEAIIKLLENINLDLSITESVRNILLKLVVGDRSKMLKVIIDYLNNINKVESIINSTVSITETFEILNKKQSEFSEGKAKTIEFASLAISLIIIDGELYVDYFGFIDKPVGGSFSLDLYRFRNFINDNITYYLFYLVTCHYCMMNEDNILDVKFDIIPEEIYNMFIFFEAIHMNKIMESIEEIPASICYKKMFTHLYKFFYEIMGRIRPEQRKKISTVPIQVPKSVLLDSEINENGDRIIEVMRDGKKVSIIIPGSSINEENEKRKEKSERLIAIKNRNNMRKIGK